MLSSVSRRLGRSDSNSAEPSSPARLVRKQSSGLSNLFTRQKSILNSSNPTSPKSPKSASRENNKGLASPAPPESLSRQDLQEFLRDQGEFPNLGGVVRLGNMCFEEIEGKGLHPRSPEMCYHASVLLEWARQNHGPLSYMDYRNLGVSHYQAWLNSGVEAENQHLVYAKEAYETALENDEIANDSSVWLEYSKVLMHLGEAEAGVRTITSMMRKFQDDGHAALYHLTAGAMLSSQGKYEQAGHYFFEAIQLGLPKFFTKSDLMFILSRSFEQLGYETKTDNNDPVEDGYVMVFTHMLSETSTLSNDQPNGSNEELLYDDWISNFETWRLIGDKCAMHGLFNLAADFYGQGLVRDRKAFSRASLWFRFAKSCFRCARTSDAQLAVKQAVTLDPNNHQCSTALGSWSRYSEALKEVVEGPFHLIIDQLPKQKSVAAAACAKIQAIYRGERLRVLLNTCLTASSSIPFFEKLSSNSFEMTVQGRGSSVSVRLHVDVHWKGSIRQVEYEIQSADLGGKLPLRHPFRLPLQFVKPENTYCITFEDLSSGSDEPSDDADSPFARAQYLERVATAGREFAISFLEKETGLYHRRHFHLALREDNTLELLEHSQEVYTNVPSVEAEVSKELTGVETSVDTIPSPHASLHEERPSPVRSGSVATRSVSLQDDSTAEKSVADTTELSAASRAASAKSVTSEAEKTSSQLEDDTASFTHASVLNDSVSAVSWHEPEDHSIAESLYSLFKPYRSRRGCHRHFATNYLYFASLVTPTVPAATANVVPSAQALKKGTESSRPQGYLSISVVQCQTDNKYTFLLPSNLSALNSMEDILPLLLLVLSELPSSEVANARKMSYKNQCSVVEINLEDAIESLTPRRHGLRVLGGKLQLLVEISSGSPGEVFIALNEQTNAPKLQQQSAEKVLNIHHRMEDAWLFLQEQVSLALECDGDSSHLENSMESSTVLEAAYPHDSQDLNNPLMLNTSLFSKESFVNDLERSLQQKHKQNMEDSDDNVSVLTFTDDYEAARRKAEADIKARERAEEEARQARLQAEEQANQERLQAEEQANQERLQAEEQANQERLQAEEQANQERLQAEQERLQAEKAARQKALAQQVAEEHRRQEEAAALEEARRQEEEALFAALHPEMGLNTNVEVSQADFLHIDTMLEGEEAAKTFRSVLGEDEALDEAQRAMELVEDNNNIQAAFFLAFQVQRIEALEFLKTCGMKAKTKGRRQEAFECLRLRAEQAIANPVPPPARCQEESESAQVESASLSESKSPRETQEDSSKHRHEEEERSIKSTSSSAPVSRVSSRPSLFALASKSSSTRLVPRASHSSPSSKPESPSPTPYNRSRSSTSPAVPVESQEEIWKAEMESKLELLMEDQLTNEEFACNPDDLVKVLHEFDLPEETPTRKAQPGEEEKFSPMQRDPLEVTRSKSLPSITSLGKAPSRPPSRPTRRSSILVSMPAEKIKAWEENLASITLSNKLNSIGKGHQNPVYFLERSRSNDSSFDQDEDECPLGKLFDDSIRSYIQKGFSSGTCAYLSVWKAKIRKFVRQYHSLRALNKAIVSLRRAYSEPLTKAGALCALSHTNGTVGEALGQLMEKSFRQEVLLVCQALPIDEVVRRIEKSCRENAGNEFGVETISYDLQTNEKIVTYPDAFPREDETPHILDIAHCSYPTRGARGSPHHGLEAGDRSVRLRSERMPVLANPKQSTHPSPKVDTFTGLPPIVTSPVPSPAPVRPADKRKGGGKQEKKQRYIRLNDAIDMLADDTESFVVMSAFEAARAREEELMLKYHPQPNSYYRTSKQKKIMKHKKKKLRNMRTREGNSQPSCAALTIDTGN